MAEKLIYNVKNANNIKGILFEVTVECGVGLISNPATYYKVQYDSTEEFVEMVSPGTFVTCHTKENIWNII